MDEFNSEEDITAIDLDYFRRFFVFIEHVFQSYLDMNMTNWTKNKKEVFYRPLQEADSLQEMKEILKMMNQSFKKSYYFSQSQDKEYQVSNGFWHFYILGLKYKFEKMLEEEVTVEKLFVLSWVFCIVLFQFISSRMKKEGWSRLNALRSKGKNEKLVKKDDKRCYKCKEGGDNLRSCFLCENLYHNECLGSKTKLRNICRNCEKIN